MEFLGSMAAELLAGESSALYTRLYEQGLIDADFAIDYERMKGLAFLEASGHGICIAILPYFAA